MKKVLLVCVCTAMLASCGQNSADYKKLKAENDSLRIENTKNTDELNDMLSTLNDIESDFQSIRDAENYLTIQQQTGGELNQSRRDQIKQNMQLISETLKKNKEQISQLEEKLKKKRYSIFRITKDDRSSFLRAGSKGNDDCRFARGFGKEERTYPRIGRDGKFLE